MKSVDIDNFVGRLTELQKYYLYKKLYDIIFKDIPKDITLCPCCNSDNFIKHGSYKGIQKYKCRTTSKIFTYKTNTIMSGIYKLDKMVELVDMMGSGNFPTLSDIQTRLNVSRPTAFYWRTKILTALYEEVDLKGNTVEFDETNERISRKGRQGMLFGRRNGKKLVGDNNYNVKVFMSYSRETRKLELVQSHMGRTASTDVGNYLDVKKGMKKVYTDSHQAYVKYFGDNKIPHEVFSSKDHVSPKNKEVHNQTLNYFSGRLESLLNHELRGVSTKYLQGYLNWIMFVQNSMTDRTQVKQKTSENKVAIDIFKQKEKEFKYFLKINGRNDYGTYFDRYYS